MLAGDGALGCPPPPLLGTSVLNVGSRDFLSHQGPLSLCPAEGAVGSGSETWRNSAGSGRGPSLPLLWKTKQALNPFLEELAPCPLCSDPATLSSPASTHAVARLGRQKAAELPRPSCSWGAAKKQRGVCWVPLLPQPLCLSRAAGRAEGWDVPAWGPAAANKAAPRWGCCAAARWGCAHAGKDGAPRSACFGPGMGGWSCSGSGSSASRAGLFTCLWIRWFIFLKLGVVF